MAVYDLIFEPNPLVNVDECIRQAQKILPSTFSVNERNEFALPPEVFSPLADTSYRRGCDADSLIEFLQRIGREKLIIILGSPLLADEWGFIHGGRRISPNMDLALGRANKSNKYAIVSSHGLGNFGEATFRASKILAHEIAHTEVYLEDGCCNDERCFMYNTPFSYREINPEVLRILDGKDRWCDFHKAVLLPPAS